MKNTKENITTQYAPFGSKWFYNDEELETYLKQKDINLTPITTYLNDLTKILIDRYGYIHNIDGLSGFKLEKIIKIQELLTKKQELSKSILFNYYEAILDIKQSLIWIDKINNVFKIIDYFKQNNLFKNDLNVLKNTIDFFNNAKTEQSLHDILKINDISNINDLIDKATSSLSNLKNNYQIFKDPKLPVIEQASFYQYYKNIKTEIDWGEWVISVYNELDEVYKDDNTIIKNYTNIQTTNQIISLVKDMKFVSCLISFLLNFLKTIA